MPKIIVLYYYDIVHMNLTTKICY